MPEFCRERVHRDPPWGRTINLQVLTVHITVFILIASTPGIILIGPDVSIGIGACPGIRCVRIIPAGNSVIINVR